MRTHERAAQIWSLLCLAARNRQILNYSIIGYLIGVPIFALAQLLEPIQSYCILNKLPALTALVFNKSGEPGLGFIAAENIFLTQNEVFEY